jgi:hypothetical protein
MVRLSQLVEGGLLQSVKPKPPSALEFSVGDAESMKRYRQPICAFTCEENSVCLVEGMNNGYPHGWELVPGFAFGSDRNLPVAHVWVRHGDEHLDPTWSRNNDTVVSLKRFRYYSVTGLLQNMSLLDGLRELAREWCLEILDNQSL